MAVFFKHSSESRRDESLDIPALDGTRFPDSLDPFGYDIPYPPYPELKERQHLSKSERHLCREARLEKGRLLVGPMSHFQLVCVPFLWMRSRIYEYVITFITIMVANTLGLFRANQSWFGSDDPTFRMVSTLLRAFLLRLDLLMCQRMILH